MLASYEFLASLFATQLHCVQGFHALAMIRDVYQNVKPFLDAMNQHIGLIRRNKYFLIDFTGILTAHLVATPVFFVFDSTCWHDLLSLTMSWVCDLLGANTYYDGLERQAELERRLAARRTARRMDFHNDDNTRAIT